MPRIGLYLGSKTVYSPAVNLVFLGIIVLLALAIAVLFALLFLESLRERYRITQALNMTLFLVRVPRQDHVEEKKSDKEHIAVMEQLISSFADLRERGWRSALLGQPHLVFELAVHHVGEEIHFYVAGPRRYEELIERSIPGFYPHAVVERVRDYNIFTPHGVHAGSILALNKNSILPLRTYLMLESDPQGAITNALSKLEREGEGAAMQVLVKPLPRQWGQLALRTAKFMQQGRSYEQAVREARGGLGTFFAELMRPRKPKQVPQTPTALTPLVQETIKALEEKAAKAGFCVIVRLVVSATGERRAAEMLQQLEQTFAQFSHPAWNSFKARRARGRALRQLLYNFSFRHFEESEAMVLNAEEVTGIFHFPIPQLATPRILWLKAKAAPPPEELPAADAEGVVIGKSVYRGQEKSVCFLREDRRRHLYLIGQTGTGKSTLLYNMIRRDIERGEGVGVIDPHGDLVEDVLGVIPRERADDLVYFNPGDTERPLGLNMLEVLTEEQKDFAVQEMIAIFYKLFPPEVIGPMFEHNMRNAMLTLMADPEDPGTVVEIPRIFTDESFLRARLAKVTDPVVRAFWEKEMAKTTEFHKSEMLGYLVSKVGRFVENEMMRNIIGQARSGFNLRDVIDRRKILLANLSKGKVGEVNSALLGMILVSKLQMAAMGRADVGMEGRADFYLYIDEFQNFTTDSIATILSEARKYRLNLILAHQFIGQLPEKIKDAAFGNVGSLCAFRVGADDAGYLAKHFAPVFSEQDLLQLDNYHAYLKLMIRNQTSRPFNVITSPAVPGDRELASQLRELARLRHGRARGDVQREILERSQLARGSGAGPPLVPGEINK